MSDAYRRDLSVAETSRYRQVAAGTLALALATMVLAVATLFGAVTPDRSVAGLSLFRAFGVAMLATGLLVAGLGLASWRGLAATAPDRVSGLVTGLLFGAIWFVAGGLVGANTLGLGTLGWAGLAPVAGGAALATTLFAREDLGATLPVGGLLVLAGLAVVSGLLGPGWAYRPATISAVFPASVVVPLLSFVTALLGGWTAGKAYEGFGTRGRQTGAYLLISLVVVAVLAVLVLLVSFITVRGFAPVVENLEVGALTGLLAVLVPVTFLGIRLAAAGLDGSTRWATARTVARTGLVAGFGAAGVVCAGAVLTGSRVALGPVAITPEARVGTGVALLALLSLLTMARGVHDGLDLLHARDTLPSRARTGLLGVGLLGTAVAGFGVATSVADPLIGLVLAPLAAGAAVAIAGYPTVLLARRALAGRPVRSAAVAPGHELKFGVVAGLAYLGLAVAFEAGSGLVPVGSPALPVGGGVATVAVAAQLVALSFLAYGGIQVLARIRSRAGARAAATETGTAGAATRAGADRDDSRDQLTLAAVGLLAALTLLVTHAVVTGNELAFLEVLTVSPFGALDWPFLMNASSGLGLQRGVMPAVLGTVWLVVGAVVMAVPLAVGAAVYLTEYASDSALTSAFEIATNGLWSTPSIVFGLFGLAFIVPRFGNSQSIFAGQLVLGFMLLPLVLITSREAMKAVPDEYRDASAALGVSRWETIRSVVVPAAMPGVITGVILGVGRIAGETAPILLVTRGANFPTQGPDVLSSFQVSFEVAPPFLNVSNPALLDAASALPLQLFAVITAGVGGNEAFAWGTALVLLSVVLSFYAVGIVSRRYFRRKLHR